MELSKVEELTAQLPIEQRTAVLQLIDLKTEQDMKEVVSSIKHLEDKFDNKTNSLDSKITTIFWVLGIIITLMVALKMFA